MSSKKYLCGYCPTTFSSIAAYDEHFDRLHRVCPMTGKVQPYKPPSIYAPEKRARPERPRVRRPDEIDLFFTEEDDKRKPPINPFS